MPKVLVSNNAELLRHFTAPPFQRLGLQLLIAHSADEAWALFRRHEPALAVIDAEPSGFDTARTIKAHHPSARVILVAGRQLSGDQLRQVSACGCDELLIAPMTAVELHDVVAIHLGEPRLGTEAFSIAVELAGAPIEATVANLSIDGVRLVVGVPIALGQVLAIVIAPEHEPAARVRVRGTAVWTQPRDGKTVVGAVFDPLDERARTVLSRLTQWQVIEDGDQIRVVLRGDFTEATRFDELLPRMVGRVVFDAAQVTYMNSLGVRAWCEFLRQLRIGGYELHACSVAFILQAAMVRDVIGRGTVTSFFAPYRCVGCDHEEERLIQTAALVVASLEPPAFACPSCGGALELDDLPERYFAFLQDDAD